MFSYLTVDGPEYTARTQDDFLPPDIDMQALIAAVPKTAWRRDTSKGLYYVARSVAVSYLLYVLASKIEIGVHLICEDAIVCQTGLRWTLWGNYWFWQGIAWAGFWSFGHEAGHCNISPITWINHTAGFMFHSFLFLPYFSWRITHYRHHKTAGSIEHEEVYNPYLRSELKDAAPHLVPRSDYAEAVDETPLVTVARFLVMQLFGLHTYLAFNTMGSKRYPPGSNHFFPSSGLFGKEHRRHVLLSDLGLALMLGLLVLWARTASLKAVWMFYIVPFMLTNHWIMTMTFLQHSCPTVPFYRQTQWTRPRGAISTVDRPFLGWIGVFFLLGVSHNHTAHHLFSSIPFYNLPATTAAITPLLGPAYNYDSTGIPRALWRSFTQCAFVEDAGDVVFYKNRAGVAVRRVRGASPCGE